MQDVYDRVKESGRIAREQSLKIEACPPYTLDKMSEAWKEGWKERDTELFDFWEAAGIKCASYSGDLDLDVYRVFKIMLDKKGNATISETLGLPAQYVELIQSIFCSIGWFDYGSSPRNAFPAFGVDTDRIERGLLTQLGREWNVDGDGRTLDPPHYLYEENS